MNKILSFFIFLSIILSFTSCEKEVIEKPDNTQEVPNQVDILPLLLNKDWTIVEAYYVSDNMDKYQKHPNVSLLTPQFGATTAMDTIIKDVTQWRFQTNQFIVDGNVILDEISPSDPKLDFDGNNTISLYFGFTTRKLEINKYRLINEGVLEIKGPYIGSLGGSDYNVVILTEDGSYSDVASNTIPSAYSMDPNLIIGLPNSNLSSELYGETWSVTNITTNANTFPGTTYPYTLVFNSNGTYTINGVGNSNRKFRIVGVPFYPLVDLELYDFSPMGGDNFVIQVSLTTITDGVIDGAVINSIYNSNQTQKRIWMNKL